MVLVPQAHNVNSISSCGDRYVLFDSYRDGRSELWRADADGSNGVKLLDEVEDSACSPDGKWIFYGAKDTLYRMPSEGGERTKMVSVAERPNSIRSHPTAARWLFPTKKVNRFRRLSWARLPRRSGRCSSSASCPLELEGMRWVPSGKALQYRLTRNGASNIWEQPLAGGEPHQIDAFQLGVDFFLCLVGGRQAVAAGQGQSN